ncbi:uncharacterized protein B0I36DRAFT_359353 [Microdochium trichocladiopsis]|uniref:RING-type domain-containing protein n=1 Tax=Microdochium trichocladiopsis TaxID=1682393 RepID=A0A9P9BUP6_9PEZI|nr:uncharacterized protein B0I36DRAFT_359353 [Microdochium trichocladiopsis]KAH7037694.1 hypothetical protein B0I36DRAFT_359353 [Microdochium trichocladiopsis]
MPPFQRPNSSRFLPSSTHTAAWRTPPRQHLDFDLDDPHLLALATTDFSSPSLPPLSVPPSPRPPTNTARPFELPRPLDDTHGSMPYPTQRRTSRAARAAGGGVVDLTKEEPESDEALSVIRDAPTSLPMPSLPRQPLAPATGATSSTSSSLRKRRASLSQPPTPRPTKSRRPDGADSDPFGDDIEADLFTTKPPAAAEESIDLSNATEVPKELLAPKVDNRVKLGKFQCVICMDDVTALTVTHCGHLFCSECLHSALHIDSNKKTCPVCRTKVDMKNAKSSKTSKTYYHLELKLMTTRKQGKRPAG